MGINKINVPRRTNQNEKKETRSLQASATTVVRWEIRPQIAENMRLIKTRDPKIGRKKNKRKYKL